MSIAFDLPVALLPLFSLMGATGTLTLRELVRARGEDAELHAWAATVAAAATTTCAARIVQRSAVDPVRATLGVSLQYSLAAVVVILFILFAPTKRPRNRRVLAVVLAFLVLHLTTPALNGHGFFLRTDVFGDSYYAVKIGPLVAILVPLGVWAAVHWMRAIRKLKGRAPWSMTMIGAVVLMFLAAFVHDVLLNRALLRSVHLMEYAFAAVAFITSALISQHVQSRYEGIASAMQHRMEELAESRHLLDRAMGELARTKREFPRLAESALDGILVHDGGRVVDANDALAEMFGTATDELRGKALADLFEGSEHADAELFGRVDAPRDLIARVAGGVRAPVEIMGRAAENDGAVLYVVSVRDIAERKQAEARQVFTDRMVSIATLAAGAAHEINNPLMYVATNIAFALETSEEMEPDVVEGLREAEEGCDRIRRIVQDLSSLSREQGDARVPVRVEAIVDRAVRMTEHQLRHRATVVRDYEATKSVVANEARLGQVFLNLLVNAAQAIPEGQASEHQVRIATRDDDDRVIVEVTDTGAGIPAEVLSRIFDPFFTTKAHAGTGLGLSVCHGIVAQLGGEISVSSTVGEGTTFRVSLPACAEAAVAKTPSSRKLPVAAARRARVLIVDDEPSLIKAIARTLRAHDVTTAESGAQALELLAKTDFDLVLCDLMMPTVTGMDVYEQVRLFDAELARRIVFMTGGAFTPRAAAFLENEATTCMMKPLDFTKIAALAAASITSVTRGAASA